MAFLLCGGLRGAAALRARLRQAAAAAKGKAEAAEVLEVATPQREGEASGFVRSAGFFSGDFLEGRLKRKTHKGKPTKESP